MSDTRISVVVPNFNNAKYLSECVSSILKQTHSNLEIIIIDDESFDDSKEVIIELAAMDSRVVPIFNEKNIGISSNRHKGIMATSGDYITTLDADDFLIDERKIEMEYKLMSGNVKKNIIAFSGFLLVDEDGVRYEKQPEKEIGEGNIFRRIFTRSCMIPRDYMFTKKQYITSGGFDPSVGIYEDWDLKLRMSNLYEFYYCGLDGIAYRRHGNGLSAVQDPSHYRWLMYVYRKNRNLLNADILSSVDREFSAFLKSNFTVKDKILSYLTR